VDFCFLGETDQAKVACWGRERMVRANFICGGREGSRGGEDNEGGNSRFSRSDDYKARQPTYEGEVVFNFIGHDLNIFFCFVSEVGAACAQGRKCNFRRKCHQIHVDTRPAAARAMLGTAVYLSATCVFSPWCRMPRASFLGRCGPGSGFFLRSDPPPEGGGPPGHSGSDQRPGKNFLSLFSG